MKTLAMILVFLFGITSCKDDPTTLPTDLPNNSADLIKGLELTFLPVNNKDNFISIYFADENTGYVGGVLGNMYKTQDGGKTWVELTTNFTQIINKIIFLNKNEGFALGQSEIIHTKDGGNTWEKVSIPGTFDLKSICFVADSLGFVVGYQITLDPNGFTVWDQIILSTKDKGVTWRQTKIAVDGTMLEVKFFNDKKGIIACRNGQLIKTTDGGLSWNVSSPAPILGGEIYSLVNENLFFSLGANSFMKSTDFGNTWKDVPTYPVSTRKLIFTSEKVGYSLGSGDYTGGDWGNFYGAIYYTTDGGTTWEGRSDLKETGIIISACFLTENFGYAVSGNKVIKIRKR